MSKPCEKKRKAFTHSAASRILFLASEIQMGAIGTLITYAGEGSEALASPSAKGHVRNVFSGDPSFLKYITCIEVNL